MHQNQLGAPGGLPSRLRSASVRAPWSSLLKSVAMMKQIRTWGVLEIPFLEYDHAWELQLALVDARKDHPGCPDVVMLLEHPAVFTVGRRGDLTGLRVGEDFLKARGYGLRVVERGGLITYHGPGQLVCYPVVDLRANGWKVVDFVGALEEVMIRIARDWGIEACRNSLNRGVWVGMEKLGSVGIAVRRGISFHGFAFNVATDLTPFSWIDPCGLTGIRMTSMERLGKGPSMEEVRKHAKDHMEAVFQVRLEEISLQELVDLVRCAR